ncbi:MAG: P1 family peptidase [Woeseiaceae bacterium]|nr:P1 family peptidase [Woeseiaceae bacterium]
MSAKVLLVTVLAALVAAGSGYAEERPRARDVGLVVGTFPTGPLNAITDVDDVLVGHATRIEGDDIRTGVTAIIPAPGNLYSAPGAGLDPCRQRLRQADRRDAGT